MVLITIWVLSFFFSSFCLNLKTSDYSKFTEWLTNNHAYISPKIIPKEDSVSNRRIIAKEKINKGEDLLYIPSALTMSITHEIINPICKKVIGEGAQNAFDCLVFFLTVDFNNPQSNWRHYYDFLPKNNAKNFPYFYSSEDKEILSKTEADKEIKVIQNMINASYGRVALHLPKGISYEDYVKNFLYVLSRNFSKDFSIISINTLVPYMDMFNHDNGENADYFFSKYNNGFIVRSIRDINIGEEINLMYGYSLDNIHLLTRYGFTFKDNPHRIRINFDFKGKHYFLPGLLSQNSLYDTMKNIQKYNEEMSNSDILYELKDIFKKRKKKYAQLKSQKQDIINIVNEESFIVERYIEIIDEFL